MSTQATPRITRWTLAAAWTVLALALLLGAAPATAQLTQYNTPGAELDSTVQTREALRERLAAAPWQAGRWRFQPRLSIGNIVYSNNVFDDNDVEGRESDVRGSANAGLEAYRPVNDDVVFVVFASPSYTWWRDNEELRRFNSNYGAALFGLFNRLETEISLRRTETERPVNNELRIPAVIRNDSAAFKGRVSIRGPWQVFATASLGETRYPNADKLAGRAPALDLLARDEQVLGVGVAYDIPSRFNLGVGWRRLESDFVNDPALRSNSGEYPFLELRVPGNKLQLEAEIGLRLLEFDDGSALTEREEAVGRLRAAFEIGSRTTLALYSSRNIVYSAVDVGGYFASDRSGVALARGETDALRASLFFETGSDEFESAGGLNQGRVDDGETYGLRFEIPLRWGLTLDLGAAETTIDSTFDEFDRSLTSVTSSVRLSLPDFPF